MSLDTAEEIQQFLILQQKSNEHLRVLCEGVELPTEGSRDELISRLMSLKVEPQMDYLLPQIVALRTKIHGNEIPGAEDFMRRARKAIFEGKGNMKDFSVLNAKGESYMMAMRYAKCLPGTLELLFKKDMVYPHPSQRELIKIIKKDPDMFTFHLVQRSYGKVKTFVMLHSMLKVA